MMNRFLVAAALVACSGSESSSLGPDVVKSSYRSCNATNPCPGGLQCGAAAICLAPGCNADGAGNGCPDGFYCVDPTLGNKRKDEFGDKRKYCAAVCSGTDETKDPICGPPKQAGLLVGCFYVDSTPLCMSGK